MGFSDAENLFSNVNSFCPGSLNMLSVPEPKVVETVVGISLDKFPRYGVGVLKIKPQPRIL